MDIGIRVSKKRVARLMREMGIYGISRRYDNALCESFFATLECELINRRSFRTHKEARLAIFFYIEGWYNPHRRHSSIAYHAPMAYEKLHLSQA